MAYQAGISMQVGAGMYDVQMKAVAYNDLEAFNNFIEYAFKQFQNFDIDE